MKHKSAMQEAAENAELRQEKTFTTEPPTSRREPPEKVTPVRPLGVDPQDYFKGQKNKDIMFLQDRIRDAFSRGGLAREEFPLIVEISPKLTEEQRENIVSAIQACIMDNETEKGQLACIILEEGEDTLVDGGIEPSNETLEQFSEELSKWFGKERSEINAFAGGRLFAR